MIELKKVSKVYKVKNGPDCVALKNISLTLPDTGMVFIVGKSGSGKSTLLNLIGGLDSVTTGKIIADGNDLTKLKPKQFDNYRSSYLTFIFQDYKLFDGLTIKENVIVGLDITNSMNEEIVNASIKKVGLDGYQDRYPYELSGGQRQRVAIARALSRNSKLLLADEPTGNLDHNTSKQILDILKTVSKRKLVVIVSHNLHDADLYADRIIEVHEGDIISDRIRREGYNNSFVINDDTCYLPHYYDAKIKETNQLLNGLKNGTITNIKQIDNGFDDVDDSITNENRNIKLKGRKATNRSLVKLLKMFFTKKLHNRIMVIVFSVLLFALLTVMQSFILFTPTLDNIDEDKSYFVLNKGGYTPYDSKLYMAPLYEVNNTEFYYFNKANKGQSIYKLNNYVIPLVGGCDNIGEKSTIALHNNFSDFFVKTTYGTLVCTEEYLAQFYPDENGNLNLLAGKAYYPKYGIIITDYIADAMIYHGVFESYTDMVGIKTVNGTTFNINAVIDTGYRDRYRELIDIILETSDVSEIEAKLKGTDLYIDYIEEVMSFLAVTYSFNPNFKDSLIYANINNNDNFSSLTFSSNDNVYDVDNFSINMSSDYNNKHYDLADDEIVMSTGLYNSIFNTIYTTNDYNLSVNNKVTLSFYTYYKGDKVVTYEKDFKIVALSSNTVIDKAVFDKILKCQIIDYGLYVENTSRTPNVLAVANKYGYYVKGMDVDSGIAINKMISSFDTLFIIILIGMYVVLFGYIILYGYNYIKSNIEDIGIYNAFGGKIINIVKIVGVDILITGTIICLLSFITVPLFVNIADGLILSSIKNLLKIGFYDMSIIRLYSGPLLTNYILLISFIVFSVIIPMLILFKLKPIEIIRNGK